MLVNCEHLDKTSSTTIVQLFDIAMHLIWPQEIEHDNVLLLVNDAAPYLIKTGPAIQVLFPKMLCVLCLVHFLHYVAKKIRNGFSIGQQYYFFGQKSISKMFNKNSTLLKFSVIKY